MNANSVPIVERAAEDEVAAVAEDDGRRGGGEEVDEREVEAVQDDGLVVRGAVAVVDLAEARAAPVLAGERLDDPHPRDVLLQRRRDARRGARERGGRRASSGGGRSWSRRAMSGKTASVASARRQSRQHEDDGRADEHERVLHEARHAVGDELVERLDVVRQPGDDRAGAVALEVAEREPLEVGEEARFAGRRARARRPSSSGTSGRAPAAQPTARRRRRPPRSTRGRSRSPCSIPSSIATFDEVGRCERRERCARSRATTAARRRAAGTGGRGARARRRAGASATSSSRRSGARVTRSP